MSVRGVGQEDQEPADGAGDLGEHHHAPAVDAVAEPARQGPDEPDDAG